MLEQYRIGGGDSHKGIQGELIQGRSPPLLQ
jgi:hypothetical protein